MKIDKLFAAALAATALFASCGKETDGNGGGNGGVKAGEAEPTYAAVDIILPASVTTRAEDATAGLAAEKAVTEIGLFIVDETTMRLDYEFFAVNATNFTESTVGDRKVYTGKVTVPTVTGTKRVWAVANPGALKTKLAASGATAANSGAFGSPKADFLSVAGNTLNSMVMSGAYTDTYDMTEAKTAAQALADPVAITIGRNLSKVVLQEGDDYTVIGGTTTLKWATVAEATDAYFIGQTAGTLYRDVPAAATSSATHDYWANFSTQTPADGDYISVPAYDANRKATATYAQSKYVFENMPADDDSFYVGNTTAARIKGVFDPETVYAWGSGAPAVTAFSAGTTFLRSKIDGTYWTETGAAAMAAANYNGHSTATFADDFLKYEDGVGYYTIYVHDLAGDNGVERNSFYLMQIDEVRGPGLPGDVIPTDPTDPVQKDTSLSATITVLNWDFEQSSQHIQ